MTHEAMCTSFVCRTLRCKLNADGSCLDVVPLSSRVAIVAKASSGSGLFTSMDYMLPLIPFDTRFNWSRLPERTGS